MKRCSKCRTEQPVSAFGVDRKRKDGLQSWCKRCYAVYNKANRDKSRVRHIRHKFGITLDDYAAMLKAQGGVCAICSQKETARDNYGNTEKPLAVDHDPKTGQIRALLCQRCNVGIGHLTDPETLLSAAAYLIQHEQEPAAIV